MGERENAMKHSTELVPYSESDRDAVELELAEEALKVDLMERRNSGMIAILYRHFGNNVCTIYVEDERVNAAYEYEVPDEGAMEAWEHAFAPKHVDLRAYKQSENDG